MSEGQDLYWKGGLHHSMKGVRCQAEELGQWMLVKMLIKQEGASD